MSTGASRHRAQLNAALAEPGNDKCADCAAPFPRWASVNLGVFLCMRCATVHRRFGTHISRVKSVTLDNWTREEVRYMRQTGNARSNAYLVPGPRRSPHFVPLNQDDFDTCVAVSNTLTKKIREKNMT